MRYILCDKILCVFFSFFFLFPGIKAKGQTHQKNVALVEVAAQIVNENGEPLANAVISANEGSIISYSDVDGNFKIKTKQNGKLLVELDGYKPFIWDITSKGGVNKLVLTKTLLFEGEDDQRSLPMLITESTRNIVGAVSRVNTDCVQTFSGSAQLSKALQGTGMGLMVDIGTGGLTNTASLYVRGKSGYSNNSALVIVDGIERSLDGLIPEEIESIEIVKDATAKILYGPRAAAGVVLVKTKEGKIHKRVRKISADFSIGVPTRLPNFINSYDYATLYNEARENDGLATIYDDDDLELYLNSEGNNDILHPDVDYYNYFLKEFTKSSKYTAEFSGGNEKARYAVVGGYLSDNGLQSVGVNSVYNRFNIRGNLDINVSKRISANMGMSFIRDFYKRGDLWDSGLFAALSNHRPNEYPLIISEDYIAKTSDGTPALGASSTYSANLLGSVKYSGSNEKTTFQNTMTLGINYDLDYITDGLVASGFVTFDSYFTGTETLDVTPATYEPYETLASDGTDSIAFITRQQATDADYYDLSSDETASTYGYTLQLNYAKHFGTVDFSSTLGYFYYYDVVDGSSTDINMENTYLRTHYVIDRKYIVEANLALMGSSKFFDDKRHFLSFALGGAWILSDEKFMDANTLFDFLKLKASWGIIGYDGATSSYLYEDCWYDNGTTSFGNSNSHSVDVTSIDYLGNADLDWEKSREVNIGLEALMLDNHFYFAANVFNERRYDMIDLVDSEWSSIYGGLYYYENSGEVKNTGFELELNWRKKYGNFTSSLGANLTYARNKYVKKDEVQYSDAYRRTEGRATDVMMGYKSLGLLGKDVDLDAAPTQTFGSYGEGDIAYADLNDDGVVDDRDKTEIGVSFPSTMFGVTVDLKYKGWGLYVLGTGRLGVQTYLNNDYYTNYGNGKYSDKAFDRYHATNNPTGTQPSLTTTEGDNNNVNSDFWLENTSFFRVKNVELSYTFKSKKESILGRSIKLYLRGANLWVISDVDELDPEAPDAGVSNNPVISTLTTGISVSF